MRLYPPRFLVKFVFATLSDVDVPAFARQVPWRFEYLERETLFSAPAAEHPVCPDSIGTNGPACQG